MTKEEKLYATAPCGLMCYGCFGYKKGGIPYHASKLHNLYRGWYSGHVYGYGENPTPEQREKLKKIEIHNEMLIQLKTQPNCDGCRINGGEGGGCIPGCIVPKCVKEHGVDFCGECPEFPCAREIPENIRGQWFRAGEFIRENGYEAWFEKNKDVAHYEHIVDPALE